ncbi:MAG: class B sortase [Ruminococcaceae bacterium]|nr:class B sortase [Oscillospiraceae bacterium]
MAKQRSRIRGFAALLLAVSLALCPACTPTTENSENSSESSEITNSSASSESSKDSSDILLPEDSESAPENSESELIESEIEIPNMSAEIAAQKENNPDTVGWIQIPNTEVNDAVVQRQGADDNDYYLRKDKDGKYSWYGCYFGDYESVFGSREELTRNNIIYAHNLGYNDNPDRPDFSQLFHYLDEDFAESNPYIFFSTEDEDMVWEIFAVFYSEDTSWYILVDIEDAVQNAIINEAKMRSQWIYDVEVDENDKLLTLSTCSYKYGGALDPQRFVVMARLVEKDKPLPATIEIEPNPEPKEPVF